MVLENTKQIEIVIERDKAQNCNMLISELNGLRISLSNSDPGDIELLFNQVFKWIIKNEKLIRFYTNDTENDLYNEVVKELITQLNNEINQSESDFDSIIKMLNENKEIDAE